MISLNLDHQQDYLSCSQNSKPSLSKPCIGLDLDRIFKSRQVLSPIAGGQGGKQDKTRFVVTAVMTNLVVRKLVLSLQLDWS